MTEITLEMALDRDMRIEKSRPPNFDAIAAVLPGALGKNVIFCYGDTIYNPGGQVIPLQLLAHEAVHSIQQELSTTGLVVDIIPAEQVLALRQ